MNVRENLFVPYFAEASKLWCGKAEDNVRARETDGSSGQTAQSTVATVMVSIDIFQGPEKLFQCPGFNNHSGGLFITLGMSSQLC